MNRVVMTSYTLLEIDIKVVAMIYHTIPYHTINKLGFLGGPFGMV